MGEGPSYLSLLRRAKAMGYTLTPALRAELRILAGVSDDEIRQVRRRAVMKSMAKKFEVPVAMMERRIKDLELDDTL